VLSARVGGRGFAGALAFFCHKLMPAAAEWKIFRKFALH